MSGKGTASSVDYKSGKVDNVDKLVESETSLQGPLYALAVRERNRLNPVAMVFLAIREGKPVGWGAVQAQISISCRYHPIGSTAHANRTIARTAKFPRRRTFTLSRRALTIANGAIFKNACRIEQTEIVRIGVAGARTKVAICLIRCSSCGHFAFFSCSPMTPRFSRPIIQRHRIPATRCLRRSGSRLGQNHSSGRTLPPSRHEIANSDLRHILAITFHRKSRRQHEGETRRANSCMTRSVSVIFEFRLGIHNPRFLRPAC